MNYRNGKPINILLVEDSKLDIKMVQEAISEENEKSNLHVIMNGEEAIDFLRGSGKHKNAPRPDLVLLDLNLPRKDGREVLADLKSDPKLQQIPVVILTSSRAEEDILKAYDLQANCYILKPIDANQFLDKIRFIFSFWLSVAELPSKN
jgi:chemotaxis family two-component system response regulator Rcp1